MERPDTAARSVLVCGPSDVAADLRGAGHHVRSTDNGAAALDLLARQPADVVVSAIGLPGCDGFAVCRAVKQAAPDTAVILLTALADPHDVVHALDAGADHLLPVPHDRQRLLNRVAAIQAGSATRLADLLLSTFADLVAATDALRACDEENRRYAHQLRNSLGVIAGYAELLSDPTDHSPDTVTMAKVIATTARALTP